MKKIILCLALTALLFACSKTESPLPTDQESALKSSVNKNLTVTTVSVWIPSAIWARPRGNISTTGGGNSIADRGFCYSTTPDPTISDDTVHAGSGAGDFMRIIYGLSPGTTYFVKSYGIKNNGDVYYGDDLSFTTLTIGMPSPGVGTVTDIDGNIYNTITLGTQVWMVENLRTTLYRDGSSIPNITDNAGWAATTEGAFCDYDNDPDNAAVYGRLYNKYAVLDTRNIAPDGWHVPSTAELITLFNYVGGYDVAGGRMKETGSEHWLSPNTGADNSSGFTAVGAGWRSNYDGTFYGLQNRNYFWSSIETYTTFILDYDSESYTISSYGCPSCWTYGYSVRCIKD